MKKILSSIIMVTLMLSLFTTGVLAIDNNSPRGPIVPSSIETSQIPLIGTRTSTGQGNITCTGTTKTYDPSLGSAYAQITSSATEMEDYITALVNIYDDDGTHLAVKNDDKQNSTLAKATATNPTWIQSGDWAEGYHRFQKSGYSTVEFNTKSFW